MFRMAKEKRFTQQAVITLMNHSIYQFGNSMSLIFLNLYLWRLTNSLLINGLFNLIALFAQAITTFSIGKIAKKKGRLMAYRSGIFITTLFYFFVLIAQEHIVSYFAFFALLKGIGQALYWLGYFTIVHEVSTDKNRHRYLGWNQIVTNGTNLAGPAVAGFIIGLYAGFQGYMIVFAAAFIMFIIAAVGSLQIKKEETHHRAYYMKYLPQMIKREPGFTKTLFGWFVIGFPHGILSFIPSILLYNIFQEEQSVAYLNVVFLSLSIIASYMISRFARMEGTVLYLTISAAGLMLSSFFLLSEVAIWSVVLFMSIQSLFKPLQQNSYEAYYYSWVNRLPLKENFRVETIVLREAIINLGRGMGIILFLIFSRDIHTSSIPWIIFAVAAFQWLIPYLANDQKPTSLKKRSSIGERLN
ncbi:MFS transporter [Bacillus sp. FJAT-50079]|uniref:MFS transporter n=1 Tax=Bacillus sp. FJAT-50079 TaxID=2833577 RepID=UPI001BCA4181|nr:MFS transporter [Bacillus sp. FJAT-50079]MBS4207854.1 MFS transporter [Bacillus sp. FJAT-50079]MBS4210842.1 MFS transporter [Bacillus sp. FJAT-50079]